MRIILLSLLISFFAFPALAEDKKESVYDRVMKNGEIRCGYFYYNPAFMKNEETGEFYGVAHDIIKAAADLLELKIKWVQEVSVPNSITDLQNDRYDMLCVGFYERPNVMKQVEFIGPFYYVSVNAYVKPDDTRFDGNIEKINNPQYKISSVDGTIPDIIWKESFSKAERLSLPELSPYSDNLLNVSTGKADVTFVENSVANEFIANNVSSLKKLEPPVRVFPVASYVNKGEIEFQTMMNSAVRHLQNNGVVEKILKKYEKNPGDYMRVTKPYEVVE